MSEEEQIKILVNKMTNWQRSQWAKAGYPGAPREAKHSQGKRDARSENIIPFTKLTKNKT